MTIAVPAGVNAVLLDAGGVLLLPDPAAFRARLAPFGVVPDDDTCRRAHYLGFAEIDRVGHADYRQGDRVAATALGVPSKDVEAAVDAISLVYLDDPFVPIAGVAEQLRRLQEAGFRLAIVSNSTGKVESELAEHSICGVGAANCAAVDIVIDSHVVGIEKPDPAIFARALDALRLPAEQCVYLGDSVYFDVGGAQAAGMKAVHVTPYGECDSDDHAHVRSVRDFADQLLGAAYQSPPS